MTINGDFWGLKIMGTPGQNVDVIHDLSPKLKSQKFFLAMML